MLEVRFLTKTYAVDISLIEAFCKINTLVTQRLHLEALMLSGKAMKKIVEGFSHLNQIFVHDCALVKFEEGFQLDTAIKYELTTFGIDRSWGSLYPFWFSKKSDYVGPFNVIVKEFSKTTLKDTLMCFK